MFRRKIVVTPKAESSGGGVSGWFVNLPQWIQGALGLQVSDLPSRLKLPDVQPVLEIYQPTLRIIPIPAFVGNVAQQLSVPKGKEWIFLSLSCLVTTDANVANRQIFIRAFRFVSQFPLGLSMNIFEASGNFNQVASTIVSYTIGAVGMVGNVLATAIPGTRDAIVQVPVPQGIRLPDEGAIFLFMQGGVAGDVISDVGLTVLERSIPEALIA
jgi:hypothetical protein